MTGQSAYSSTSSLIVAARHPKSGGSISGANCFEAILRTFRCLRAVASVIVGGTISPNFLGDRKLKLRENQAISQEHPRMSTRVKTPRQETEHGDTEVVPGADAQFSLT